MEALIHCDNIRKRVGNFILRDIHFELEPGYIMGVIGGNGAGKSTLVRVLLGSYKLYTPADYTYITKETKSMRINKGDVYIEGYSIKNQSKEYKSRTAYILNDCPFPMEMSAKENGILYGRYYDDFSMEEYEKLCREYEVPFTQPLKQLSKGEQIKMQLAFSLCHSAKIYIMDEPAGNLDVKFRDRFYDTMRSIVEPGDKSIIYVTHLVEELEQIADYVLWLNEGKQKAFGTLEELLDEYLMYSGSKGIWKNGDRYEVIYLKTYESHCEALLWSHEKDFPEQIRERCRRATLKEIMHYEEEKRKEIDAMVYEEH